MEMVEHMFKPYEISKKKDIWLTNSWKLEKSIVYCFIFKKFRARGM